VPIRDYTTLSELGAGATGTVEAARHEPTGELVAIKRLSPEFLGDETFLDRFRAEAAVLRTIQHPNIVALYEYIEAAGLAAIVMELVRGAPLQRLISSGPTRPEAALAVMRGSLLGLQEAHRAGIVHRDYKPANVLVDGAGRSRLVDFGIAVRRGEGGWRAGTPEYMAPEQWAAGEATPQTDVYAASAVLYECLAGHPPFDARDNAMLRLQHQSAPVPVQDVPEPVRSLVRQGMAKSPAERFGTAGEFLGELEDAARRGYGHGWEEQGLAVLGGAAVGVVALLPIASVLGGGAATVASGPAVSAATSISPLSPSAPATPAPGHPVAPPAQTPAATPPAGPAHTAPPPHHVAPGAPHHVAPTAPHHPGAPVHPAAQPPAVHPAGVHPPGVEPPATHAPPTHTPGTHPVAEPPAAHPPETHPTAPPPATHPPATQPPATHAASALVPPEAAATRRT